MKKHIAILRGINVGGKRKLLMADLSKMLSQLGFENITTYIQSGNAIFETKETEISGLENKIKEAISEKFDLDVPVIIRTVEEINALAGENPYDQENIDQLHVTFLKKEPSGDGLEKIQTYIIPKDDDFRILGKNVYIQCSGRYSDSKLTNKFFEDKLKVSATTRNWKTILKLLELSR